jgi:hypothetical protein
VLSDHKTVTLRSGDDFNNSPIANESLGAIGSVYNVHGSRGCPGGRGEVDQPTIRRKPQVFKRGYHFAHIVIAMRAA